MKSTTRNEKTMVHYSLYGSTDTHTPGVDHVVNLARMNKTFLVVNNVNLYFSNIGDVFADGGVICVINDIFQL